MARKQGQIIARGQSTWLVRIYQGRDPQNAAHRTAGSPAKRQPDRGE